MDVLRDMLIKMSQINEVLCPIPSPRHELLGDETGAEMAIIECMVGTTFIGTIHYLPHINPLILRKTKALCPKYCFSQEETHLSLKQSS